MGRRRNWEEVAAVVKKIQEHNLTLEQGAKEYGIRPRILYEFNRRKRQGILDNAGLPMALGEVGEPVPAEETDKEKSDAAAQTPAAGLTLPLGVRDLIIAYRKAHPDQGYKRIQDHLQKDHFVVVSRKHIREVLKRAGLATLCDSSFDTTEQEQSKGARRFEAPCPRDLYQMDVTYVYISGIPVLYLVNIVDDYSRFCVASELCVDQRAGTMIETLHRAIDRYGKPRRLLTDQGSSFYTWSVEQTQFQRYLDDMRIEHIVSDPHSPQTLGKVERLNQTIKRELLEKRRFEGFEQARAGIADYIHRYNYTRPHQGIGGAIPWDRFSGVAGEVARVESHLCSTSLDFSKGYLIFKGHDHTLSVIMGSAGLRLYLDGTLLQKKEEQRDGHGDDQEVTVG
jgi:transposase InsO family protein